MTLADKYMRILTSINQTPYDLLNELTQSDPVLSSLLSQKYPEKIIKQLQILQNIPRRLSPQQVAYVLSIRDSPRYLSAISCLKNGGTNIIRKQIEKIFFQEQIPLQMMSILLTKYHIPQGVIEKSKQLWQIINLQIDQPSVIPLMEKLSVGKTPQKQELDRIVKFIKLLYGDNLQQISKTDIQKVIQTQNSKIQKQSILRGTVRIISKLKNITMKSKISQLFIFWFNTILQKEIDLVPFQNILELVKLAVHDSISNQQAVQILRLLQVLYQKGLLNTNNYFIYLEYNSTFMQIFFKLQKQPSKVENDVLSSLQKHSEASIQLYRSFLQFMSPALFSSIKFLESVEILKNVPIKYVGITSEYLNIREHLEKQVHKISNNCSLMLLFYFNNMAAYVTVINSQIKDLHQGSYTSPKSILQLLQHVNSVLIYSKDAAIHPLILQLLRQLYISKEFSFESESIYQNLSKSYQTNLVKHFRSCWNQPETQKLYPHMLHILKYTKQIQTKEVAEFLNKIYEFHPQSEHMDDVAKALANYHIPQSQFLQYKFIKNIQNADVLVDILTSYNIQVQFTSDWISKIRLTPRFVEYFQKSYPSIASVLPKTNWYYHKLLVNKQLLNMYKQCSIPRVFNVSYRGNLFLDMPLVFQYLTPHRDQLYFSNYTTYMTLLYCQLLIQSQTINKTDILRYLFQKVKTNNLYDSQLNQQYYTNLIHWKLFVLSTFSLLKSEDRQLISQILTFLLKDIENKNLPVLRQYMQLIFSKLLSLDHSLIYPLLDKLKNQNSVNVNAPVILSLGMFMLQHRSEQIFQVLISYISSHTAYVRALSQYYCFEYLKLHKEGQQEKQKFLLNMVRFMEESKESKKLLKNIKIGVQLFGRVVKNMGVRSIMTVNFQKCQNDIIDQLTFEQLQSEGVRFLLQIFAESHSSLKPLIQNKIQLVKQPLLVQPSFQQYLNLYQKQDELIIVASLLQKFPNFGHLVRTCSQYKNITLCFPTRNILGQNQYKELIPQEYKCSIIEIKQKDILKYLTVQKSRGYKLIALQQTSNSVTIDKFCFPRKAVIVLGNERIGMNSTIIDMMDHLVEIQQFGKVRSLNVHVSSVILLWSYLKGRMN